MSIPVSACLRTHSATALRIRPSYNCASGTFPVTFAFIKSRRSLGRGRLPTCVVKIRCVFGCFISVSMLQACSRLFQILVEESDDAWPRISQSVAILTEILKIHERVRHLRIHMGLIGFPDLLHHVYRWLHACGDSCIVLSIEPENRRIDLGEKIL